MDMNTKTASTVKKASNIYYSLAWMNMASHTECLLGDITGDEFYFQESNATEIAKKNRELTGRLCKAYRSLVSGEAVQDELFLLRETIVKQVEAITSYVSELAIYEDLFKRIQSAFRTDVPAVDEEAAAKEILQGIFSSEDPMITNMRIQHMVSCLPVRMTKNRFYDLLAQNLALYKDADTEALESFRYRILTVAGLKECEGSAEYAQVVSGIEEFRSMDIGSVTEPVAEEALAQLNYYGDLLQFEGQFLGDLQRFVNCLLTIALLKDCEELNEESRKNETEMGRAISMVIAQAENFLNGREVVDTSEETEEIYVRMEGRLEELSEEMEVVEGRLQSLAEKDEVWAASEEATGIGRITRLMSTSDYAELEERDAQPLTGEMLAAATKEILEAFERGFENKERRYVRSVMSFVLRELPVFFDSRTEVMNYLLQALRNCKSNGEKQLAIDEIRELFEDLSW